jgi:hypothetical protein
VSFRRQDARGEHELFRLAPRARREMGIEIALDLGVDRVAGAVHCSISLVTAPARALKAAGQSFKVRPLRRVKY